MSPFVGRILDWHKKNSGMEYDSDSDPGVLSVKNITKVFRTRNFDTKVMAASFRNVNEIIELAGVDLLTISPTLLEQLSKLNSPIKNTLSGIHSKGCENIKPVTHQQFVKDLKEDQCAFELLHQGIDKFQADTVNLEELIGSMIKEL